MALIFADGFDHYATADIPKKWSLAASYNAVSSTGGRRNGGWLNPGTCPGPSKFINSATTMIVGFAYSPGTAEEILRLSDSNGIVHIVLTVNAGYGISVCRGTTSTVLGSTISGIVTPLIFSYIETKATIDNVSGSVIVRINGVEVLNLTGIDTNNNGLASIGKVSVCGSANPKFDDLYICDTSGTTNNDFLGDIRIDTLFPDADGTYSQFTPSTGTSHFALVDETAPNTTDYNDGLSVGDRDSYSLQNLSPISSQAIYGVQVNAAIAKDDSGTKSATTFVRSGTANSDSSSKVLSTSQTFISSIHELNPSTSTAWTESSVNSMEAGVLVTA